MEDHVDGELRGRRILKHSLKYYHTRPDFTRRVPLPAEEPTFSPRSGKNVSPPDPDERWIPGR